MRFWTSMFLDRCNSLIAAAVLVTIAGCARFGKHEPVPVPGIDGARLANVHTFAPDVPPLPSGYLDIDAYIEDGLLAPMRNPDTIPAGVKVEYGVVYGRADGYDLVLDLYRPENLEQPASALVFIHGGGWSRHGRDYYLYWASRYAMKGYVCVSIDYRISEEAPFPAAVEDAKCALRWVRANAQELSIDPNRIAVIGQSAGGHLAMMVGYSPDVEAFDGDGGNPGISSAVRAVVSFYGPTDLTAPIVSKEKAVKRFMGRESQKEAPERYAAASPLRYITADDPPTLIFHGTADDLVPVEQSDRLAAALDELGIPYVYDRQDGWNHAMDIWGPVNERCLYVMDRFFERFLKP